MKKVVAFLTANPVQYLTTVGRDGKAKCRPFMFCFERRGKLLFCTNNQMEGQGYEEPTGQVKITKAYNLPCDYVLHTVGPIIEGRVTPEEERLLTSCYRSCLELAG